MIIVGVRVRNIAIRVRVTSQLISTTLHITHTVRVRVREG